MLYAREEYRISCANILTEEEEKNTMLEHFLHAKGITREMLHIAPPPLHYGIVHAKISSSSHTRAYPA